MITITIRSDSLYPYLEIRAFEDIEGRTHVQCDMWYLGMDKE